MELRVLGPVGIEAGGQVVPIRSRLQRTLLAMLVADVGHVVAVDRIVDVLWDSEDWDVGHSRLWFHVSKLRSRLGVAPGAIERSGHGYRLTVDMRTVDAVRFERGAARARAAVGDDPARAATLAASALGLWRGEPYADVDDDAVGPADRIRLDELRLATVELWADAELRCGRAHAVVPELERLVADHPFRDGLRLQLMRALSVDGRRGEALATFERARARSWDDLGIGPSRALRELATRIAAGDGGLVPGVPTGGRARAYGGDVMVGRDADLRRLLEIVRGPVAIRFVSGEAGAGKSTLLGSLVRRAETMVGDLVAIRATCHARTGPSDPFGPLRDVARRLDGDGAAAPVGMVTDVGAARLVALAPLPVAAGDALDAMEDHGDVRTVGAVADLVRRAVDAVTARARVLLVVDDLQWSDEATLDVLSALAARAGDGLGIVVAYRPHEPGAERVRLLEAELQADSTAPIVVDLDAGTAAERRAFVDALLDREPNSFGDDLRAWLTTVGDGHALFTVELVDDLLRRGEIQWRDGRYEHVGSIDDDAVPVRLRAVVASRFAPVAPSVMALLRAASVEGETFTSAVVALAVGRDEEEVVDALGRDAVGRHEVVVPVGVDRVARRAVQRFSFRHQLFQRQVYDELGPVERARLHGRVAAAIAEITAGSGGDEWALSLAHHHEAAGELDAAVEQLLRAARRAVRLAANDVAVRHLEHGLALLGDVPAGASRDALAAQLHLELGMARAIVDGFAARSVEDCFLRSSALLGDSPTRDAFRARFGLWAGAATRGEMTVGARHAEVLVSVAETAGDPGLRLAAMHARWTQQLFDADIDGCVATVERSLSLYRRERDHRLGLRYGNHDPAVCGRAVGALAAALAGDVVRADRLGTAAEELATVLDHQPSLVQALALRCWRAQLAGDVAGVTATARRCLGLEAAGAVPLWFGIARAMAAWASAVAGADRDVLAALEREVATQVAIRARSWSAVHGSLLADAYTAAGRPADALRVADTTPLPDSSFYACELTRARGEALAALGDTRAAADLLLRAMDEAGGWRAAALVLRAALALATVAPEVASPHLAAALAAQPAGARSPLRSAAEAALGA